MNVMNRFKQEHADSSVEVSAVAVAMKSSRFSATHHFGSAITFPQNQKLA
jgi:hypothetical protein